MHKGQKDRWLAAHLYYNEPWEEFLAKAVAPYINTVIKTGVAEQYFFVRYWDRGPHIRLRFKGDATVIEKLLRPNLLEHFEGYFESKPSRRTEPNYPDLFPEEFKWLPNNSVQFFNYEPEFDRYGGPTGLGIVEKQFQASSDIALENIKSKGFKWSYDDALGTAIKLHLSFAYAMGMSADDVEVFFQMIFNNWLPKSFRFYKNNLNTEEYQELAKETIDSFERAYNLQKSAIIPFVGALWEALNAEEEFEDEQLDTWIKKNQVINLQLLEAAKKSQLSPERSTYKILDTRRTAMKQGQELLWNIYADLIHMTNNRLGILNKDEGYLGFLIMKSIRVKDSNSNQDSATPHDDPSSIGFKHSVLDGLY